MKVVLTGGGTGGHVYPALAVADKIREREPDSEIMFLGSSFGFEAQLVPQKGYDYTIIHARGMEIGGGFFSKVKELIASIIGTGIGIGQAKRELKKLKPQAVLGTGGFVSLPVILAANSLKIPCYIHEQNTYPGRGNMIMAKYAKKVMLGFDEAREIFPEKEKMVFVGNPVRDIFLRADKNEARKKLGISLDDFFVFSFGGSMGSNEINLVAMEHLKRVKDKPGHTVVMGTGEQFYEKIQGELAKEGIETSDKIRVYDYIENMDDHIAAADLIIARAGALTIAEITTCGRAAIYIPLSWSVNNHQYYNAKSIVDRGGGLLVDETTMDVGHVCDQIDSLAEDKEKLRTMEEASKKCSMPYAADSIYEVLKG